MGQIKEMEMIMKKILPIMALVSFSVISFAKDNYDEKCSLVKNVEIGLSVYPTIIESINNYFLNKKFFLMKKKI